jgi:hypothetical protein
VVLLAPFIQLQNKNRPPSTVRARVRLRRFGRLTNIAKDAGSSFSLMDAGWGHRARAPMDIPQCFESAHSTNQRVLLFIVIRPRIPQLAIAKVHNVFRYRNTLRQFGRIRLGEDSKVQVSPRSFQ